MKSAMLAKLIEFATKEVGVREVGDNSGKRVREYQAATTLGGSHWPWCAAFVAFIIALVCRALKIKNLWCNSASCDVILAFARAQGILHSTPQPGDVFLVMASKYDATHTGFVISVNGARFTEISGNTNNTGSRNGNGVYRQTRTNGDRYLFVRWMDLHKSDAKPMEVIVKGETLPAKLINGSHFIPTRAFGEAVGNWVEWNDPHQTVMFDGREFPKQIRNIDGTTYAGVNDLASFANMAVKVDAAAGIITVG